FNVNVKAPFLLGRECAKIMASKGGGSIINVTTVGAERGGPMMGMYMASKAALKSLTMCMAIEWASINVRVNAVGPGMTKTDFSKPIWMNPEMEKQLIAKIPMGRLGEPEDIAGAVLFLCSDSANYITGQTIYVDGGSLALG
ncbi:SDR family oxidoreductase, partial [Candidatus Micrarchaeota archaeon]|nr:SDR family oxidoreductase [Candidatus Micrarchaeota archaeon]